MAAIYICYLHRSYFWTLNCSSTSYASLSLALSPVKMSTTSPCSVILQVVEWICVLILHQCLAQTHFYFNLVKLYFQFWGSSQWNFCAVIYLPLTEMPILVIIWCFRKHRMLCTVHTYRYGRNMILFLCVCFLFALISNNCSWLGRVLSWRCAHSLPGVVNLDLTK